MLGIVEESTSRWRRPLVLVPKPDGSIPFYIDFRLLNVVSSFDAVQLHGGLDRFEDPK